MVALDAEPQEVVILAKAQRAEGVVPVHARPAAGNKGFSPNNVPTRKPTDPISTSNPISRRSALVEIRNKSIRDAQASTTIT
jgi:hypothetical protein